MNQRQISNLTDVFLGQGFSLDESIQRAVTEASYHTDHYTREYESAREKGELL